jgi:hypothetical protein
MKDWNANGKIQQPNSLQQGIKAVYLHGVFAAPWK